MSINGHGRIAESSDIDAEQFHPGYDASMRKLGRERGWPAPTREQYDLLRSPRGALLVGNPESVAKKIRFQYDIFRNTRYLIYLMGMPHDTVMRAIELYGTRVAPLVREGLRQRGVDSTAAALAD